MHTLLIVIPAVFAVSCYAVPGPRVKLALLETGAVAHFATVVCSWAPWFSHAPVMFLELDPLAHLFVSLTSLLFLSTSVYFLGYHRKTLVSERVFLACMFALLASLCAVCMSRHLGVLWVSMEAASLAATPLIYFRLSARSLEATWKFLLMNSVGIALALLGVFCIAISTMRATPDVSLALRDLTSRAHELDVAWLRSGFLLMLVGFGTKLGLAPLHGWKPDAYGEAPPPIAALLSGGVTLGAFIGIVRVFEICVAAGLAEFAGHWLVVFGLVSIGTAAVFVIGATDYRRILAYTSVEHVGVMVIGGRPRGRRIVCERVTRHAQHAEQGRVVYGRGVFLAAIRKQPRERCARGASAFAVGRDTFPGRSVRDLRSAAIRDVFQRVGGGLCRRGRWPLVGSRRVCDYVVCGVHCRNDVTGPGGVWAAAKRQCERAFAAARLARLSDADSRGHPPGDGVGSGGLPAGAGAQRA